MYDSEQIIHNFILDLDLTTVLIPFKLCVLKKAVNLPNIDENIKTTQEEREALKIQQRKTQSDMHGKELSSSLKDFV